MYLFKDLPLAERFACFVNGLCRVVADQLKVSTLTGPMIVSVWKRLQYARRRFDVLVAQVRAGTLPAVRPKRVRVVRAGVVRVRKPALLPRRFGWLPGSSRECWHINFWKIVLEEMLADPELGPVVAAAPEMGRLLRPICHMLAIRPPQVLSLPKRVRKKKEPPPPDPHPEMSRWPHLTMRQRCGPKWMRDRDKAEDALLAARKKREEGG